MRRADGQRHHPLRCRDHFIDLEAALAVMWLVAVTR
jgi:hypothetical protein